MVTYLYPLWLFFTAFYLYFAYVNWRQSSEDIRQFTIRDRNPDAQDQTPESGLSQANIEFAHDFNRYIGSVNQHNRSRYRAAAVGYFISALIALASLGILLFAS